MKIPSILYAVLRENKIIIRKMQLTMPFGRKLYRDHSGCVMWTIQPMDFFFSSWQFYFPSAYCCNILKVQIYLITSTFIFVLIHVQEVNIQPWSVKLTGLFFVWLHYVVHDFVLPSLIPMRRCILLLRGSIVVEKALVLLCS